MNKIIDLFGEVDSYIVCEECGCDMFHIYIIADSSPPQLAEIECVQCGYTGRMNEDDAG